MNPIWEAKHFNIHRILWLYCEVEAAWKERECSWKRHLTATPEHAENLARTAAHKRFWFAPSLLSIDKLLSIALLFPSVSLIYMERRRFNPDSERFGHSGMWRPSFRQVTSLLSGCSWGMFLWTWQCVPHKSKVRHTLVEMIIVAQSDCHSFEKPFILESVPTFLYE